MKKFYLCTGNIPKGPFKAEELMQRGITRTDLIWCEGFLKCKLAVDIAELKKFFLPASGDKSAKAKTVITKQAYNISQDLEVLYPEKNPNSKYISLLILSLFAAFTLIIYYCIIEFLY